MNQFKGLIRVDLERREFRSNNFQFPILYQSLILLCKVLFLRFEVFLDVNFSPKFLYFFRLVCHHWGNKEIRREIGKSKLIMAISQGWTRVVIGSDPTPKKKFGSNPQENRIRIRKIGSGFAAIK